MALMFKVLADRVVFLFIELWFKRQKKNDADFKTVPDFNVYVLIAN